LILGIGLDVVAVERIARSLSEGGGTFEEHIFTPAERAACQARADRARALAARRPVSRPSGPGARKVHLSLTHEIEVKKRAVSALQQWAWCQPSDALELRGYLPTRQRDPP